MPNYGAPLYWSERYAADPSASFDWYLTWTELKPIVAPLLSDPDAEIFMPGCGNSTLVPRMYADGHCNISAVDISPVVIAQMRERYGSELVEVDFSECDVTRLADPGHPSYADPPDACFDVVLDKGCLDAVLCGEDALARVRAAVAGYYRVLKPGGTLAVVSHGEPKARLGYFRLPADTPGGGEWASQSTVEVPKPAMADFKEPPGSAGGSKACYYVYLLTK